MYIILYSCVYYSTIYYAHYKLFYVWKDCWRGAYYQTLFQVIKCNGNFWSCDIIGNMEFLIFMVPVFYSARFQKKKSRIYIYWYIELKMVCWCCHQSFVYTSNRVNGIFYNQNFSMNFCTSLYVYIFISVYI